MDKLVLPKKLYKISYSEHFDGIFVETPYNC